MNEYIARKIREKTDDEIIIEETYKHVAADLQIKPDTQIRFIERDYISDDFIVAFVDDDGRRHMAELKWQRFPIAQRIPLSIDDPIPVSSPVISICCAYVSERNELWVYDGIPCERVCGG